MEDVDPVNQFTLLIMQAMEERNAGREHTHRNLTRVRPYKA